MSDRDFLVKERNVRWDAYQAAREAWQEASDAVREYDKMMEGHRCTSDCRREGCEEVQARQLRAEERA